MMPEPRPGSRPGDGWRRNDPYSHSKRAKRKRRGVPDAIGCNGITLHYECPEGRRSVGFEDAMPINPQFTPAAEPKPVVGGGWRKRA